VLELSQTLILNATLETAAIEEQVTVIGQTPLIDVKSTVKGQTMTKEVFEKVNFTKTHPNGQQEPLKLQRPMEVAFEGVDTSVYKKDRRKVCRR
jgi:hypothetical protein